MRSGPLVNVVALGVYAFSVNLFSSVSVRGSSPCEEELLTRVESSSPFFVSKPQKYLAKSMEGIR